MEIKLKIEVTAQTARRVAAVGTTLLVIGIAAVVHALPVTFTPNTTLTASQLNENFSDLDKRLTAVTGALPAVTEWVSYSPVISGGSTAISTQTTSAKWRRVGDSVEVRLDTNFTGCAVAGQLHWSLPSGVVPDTTKLPSNGNPQLGTGTLYNVDSYAISPLFVGGSGANTYVGADISPSNVTGGIYCSSIGNGNREVRMEFSVPVKGWTSTSK